MAVATKKKSGSSAPKEQKSKVNPFHQRLARLTYHQACQMLGGEGRKLLAAGLRNFDIDTE